MASNYLDQPIYSIYSEFKIMHHHSWTKRGSIENIYSESEACFIIYHLILILQFPAKCKQTPWRVYKRHGVCLHLFNLNSFFKFQIDISYCNNRCMQYSLHPRSELLKMNLIETFHIQSFKNPIKKVSFF